MSNSSFIPSWLIALEFRMIFRLMISGTFFTQQNGSSLYCLLLIQLCITSCIKRRLIMFYVQICHKDFFLGCRLITPSVITVNITFALIDSFRTIIFSFFYSFVISNVITRFFKCSFCSTNSFQIFFLGSFFCTSKT